MNHFRRTAIGFLTAGLLAGPALADDRGVLTAYLEDTLSSVGRQITITGFQGALASQATIAEMTIADGTGVWLTLKGVTLDWDRATLLGGVLVVRKLTADDILLDRLPQPETSSLPSAEAMPFALPVLPVSISLGDISAKHIRLGAPVLGEAVEGTASADASLLNGQGHLRLTLDRSGDVAGHFSAIAVYANATNTLTLALDAEEAANGLAVKAMGVPGHPAAHLILGGKGPLDAFAANLKLDTDGQTRLAGGLQLTGTGEGGTDFTASLAGNMAPLFLPDYAAFFGNSLSLQATGHRTKDGVLTLPQLSLSAAAVRLDGQLTLGADGLPERAALVGHLGLPSQTPLLLPLTGAETRVDAVDLTLDYDRSLSDDWTADIVVAGLDRDDFGAKDLRLRGKGRVRHEALRGIDAKMAFAGTGLVATDAALAKALGSDVTGQVALDWTLGTGHLQLSELSLTAGDLAIATTGKIGGIDTGLRLDGTVRLQAADLGRFDLLLGRPLAGAADLDLTGWVSPLSGQFDADMNVSGKALQTGIAQADGFLAGTSQLRLAGRRDETGTTVRRLQIQADGLTADLSGQIATAGSRLTGQVGLADLGTLDSALAGQITANAAFTGTLEDGHLTLTGTGTDLALGQAQADALLSGQTDVTLDLHLAGPAIDITKALISGPALQATATGRFDSGVASLQADVTLPQLAALKPGWGGAAIGQFRIDGPLDAAKIAVTATSSGLRLGQSQIDRLIGGAGRLTAAMVTEGSRLKIDDLDFVTDAASVKASGLPESLNVVARIANLAVILPEFPGALTAEGTWKQTAAGSTLDLNARGPGQIAAKLTGTIAPDFRSANLATTGTAQAGLANVLIAPRVIAGATRFDLALRGPFALSSISGTVAITDGRLADPDIVFGLTGIDATARLVSGSADVTASGAISTGGTVTVSGRVSLTPPLASDLKIRVQDAVLRDPDLYTARLSGDLTFNGPALGGGKVAGTVSVTKAELRIPSSGFNTLPVMSDLRHIDDTADVRATRQRAGLEGASARAATGGGGYGLDLRVLAPNQLFIRGRGLDAELGGQLRLGGTTAAIVPAGALSLIRGRLDLLGKRLTLSEATLQMQGALVPYLQISASTESDGYLVSVKIEGDALNPNVTFTSSPDLPQEEALARLLFDKNLQSLSPFQAAQLAGAVATLAGQGGEGVIGRLRKSAGLDNLDLQSDGTGNTSLTVGKYLSQKVYTEVTVDQDGKSTINLNLDVSSHITLRGKAASDGQTGIGIFLEKDY